MVDVLEGFDQGTADLTATIVVQRRIDDGLSRAIVYVQVCVCMAVGRCTLYSCQAGEPLGYSMPPLFPSV